MSSVTDNYFNDEELDSINFRCEAARDYIIPYLKTLIKDYQRKTETRSVAHLESRIKDIDRVYEKLRKRKLEINEDNLYEHIHDLVGIRLVCPFLHDVYNIINLIKSSGLYICNEKDFITEPKESGYMGYHMIIKVPVNFTDHTEFIDAEIQIKTSLMHAWDTVQHNVYELQRSGNEIDRKKYKLLQIMSDEFMLNDKALDKTFDINKFNEISKNQNYDQLFLETRMKEKVLKK